MELIRPMLACKINDKAALDFSIGYVASPKIDGFRATIQHGQVISRSGKLLPNKFVQATFGLEALNGLDGELVVGLPTAEDVYRQTNSGVTRIEGEPDVSLIAFDDFSEPELDYNDRYAKVQAKVAAAELPRVMVIESTVIRSLEHLEEVEKQYLAWGYEGYILRNPANPYKFGRSTFNQGTLLKGTIRSSSEAVITGFTPLMRNLNEGVENSLGYTERSTHKENLVATEAIGALEVKDVVTGAEFNIGTGFSQKEREELWKVRDTLPGRIITYDYFGVGMKGDIPRQPSYKGFRDPIDM